MIDLMPITQRKARAWVNQVHRHLDYPRGDVCRVSLVASGQLIAVGVGGRPLTEGREWDRPSRGRRPVASAEQKRRWFIPCPACGKVGNTCPCTPEESHAS